MERPHAFLINEDDTIFWATGMWWMSFLHNAKDDVYGSLDGEGRAMHGAKAESNALGQEARR